MEQASKYEAQHIEQIKAAFQQKKPSPSSIGDDIWLGETVPVEAIPNPDRFNLVIKQVEIKKKIGAIIIPGQVVDTQSYTHGMAVVVKAGPSVYRGKKFEDMGLTPEDGPKVGDVVFYESRAPRRFKVDGEEFLVIPDDAVIARFDRAHLNRIGFNL